jgi:hypothetical protein
MKIRYIIQCINLALREIKHGVMYIFDNDYFDYYNRTDKKYYEN